MAFFFSLFAKDRTRTHSRASVRWTLAETSANTGFYLYFRLRRKCKSSPASATNNANRKRHRCEKPRNHNGFWVFYANFQGGIQKILFPKND